MATDEALRKGMTAIARGFVDMQPKLIQFTTIFTSNVDPFGSEHIPFGQDVTFDLAGKRRMQLPDQFQMHINSRGPKSLLQKNAANAQASHLK